MTERIAYRLKNGVVMRKALSRSKCSRGSVIPVPLHENVWKGYYRMECEHGSRFPSRFTKNQIKQAWEHDAATR